MPILVNNLFSVDYKVGEGGFGQVYAGTELSTGRQVALKLMHNAEETSTIRNEAMIYAALAGGTGIARLLWFGTEGEYFVLAHELLGPTLCDLKQYSGYRFSLKTVLMLADQAIMRLAFIHRKGYVHCDVKPENFLMGSGRQGNVLYIIDFGISRRLVGTSRRCKQQQGLQFIGTVLYASINNHKGREQSWGDDLESLGYVLLHWVVGSLPWQSSGLNTDQETEMASQKKISMSSTELCDGLPDEFRKYIDYVRLLKYRERPNYSYLRRLFRNLFKARNFKYDHIYDWTEKRFRELHDENQREEEDPW